jgi:hypothetical protein
MVKMTKTFQDQNLLPYHPNRIEDLSLDWPSPSPVADLSLTGLLRQIPRKLAKQHEPKVNFQKVSHIMQNPYPNWVNEQRCWGNLGTLTDYIIRKFLQMHYNSNLQHVPVTLAENIIEYRLPSYLNAKISIPSFYSNAESWISIYNETTDLLEALKASCNMVNLDLIYRSGRLDPSFLPSDNEIQSLVPFYRNIETFMLEKFKKCKKLWLNPTLGNNHYFKGDADLIVDHCLLDIKTTKNPNKMITSSIPQLFGYVSMQTWLQYYQATFKDNKNVSYTSLTAPRIQAIGFLLPCQLEFLICSIKAWTDKERLKFLHFLVNSSTN